MIHRVIHPVVYKPWYLPTSLNSGGGGGGGEVPVTPGGNDEYTTLLLESNTTDGSVTFADSSFYNGIVTNNGNAKHVTNEQKFGLSSIYFDGSGDYLALGEKDRWFFGTQDFTIDFWMMRDEASGGVYIMGQSSSGGASIAGSNFQIWIKLDGDVTFGISDGVAFTKVVMGTINDTTTWHHLAAVRSGNDLFGFQGGVLQDTKDVTGKDFQNDSASGSMSIGRPGDYVGVYYKGWLDEVRLSRGIARWTENFDVPTETYAEKGRSAGTKLLVHGGGADGSSVIADSSDSAHIITNAGLVYEEDYPNLDTSSIYCNGASHASIENSRDFSFGGEDFTVDLWIRRKQTSQYGYPISKYGSGTKQQSWMILLQSSNILQAQAHLKDETIAIVTFDGIIPFDVWTHIAFVRSGNNFMGFQAGTKQSSVIVRAGDVKDADLDVVLGRSAGALDWPYFGYIDEVSVERGSARWTDDFTPPTTPYT